MTTITPTSTHLEPTRPQHSLPNYTCTERLKICAAAIAALVLSAVAVSLGIFSCLGLSLALVPSLTLLASALVSSVLLLLLLCRLTSLSYAKRLHSTPRELEGEQEAMAKQQLTEELDELRQAKHLLLTKSVEDQASLAQILAANSYYKQEILALSSDFSKLKEDHRVAIKELQEQEEGKINQLMARIQQLSAANGELTARIEELEQDPQADPLVTLLN